AHPAVLVRLRGRVPLPPHPAQATDRGVGRAAGEKRINHRAPQGGDGHNTFRRFLRASVSRITAMPSHATALLCQLHRLIPPTDSDATLLTRWVGQRDEAAFADLVARHGPMVLGVCRRVLGDAQHAEDVFQATFLVLARRAANLRRPEALPGFLY